VVGPCGGGGGGEGGGRALRGLSVHAARGRGASLMRGPPGTRTTWIYTVTPARSRPFAGARCPAQPPRMVLSGWLRRGNYL
jgi:hypothetical protein